jgi:1-acyl-sn-glycerol-3-phosphate acyltransferase
MTARSDIGRRRHRPTAADALSFCFEQLVRGGLRGIWVRGDIPDAPCIWAANHHSWWDGFVANAVLRQAKHTPALLMDAANLERFAFLKKSGALPADQPRSGLAALRAGQSLIIFPEGELRAPGPIASVAPGAAWLARHAQVPLIAAPTRVVLRGHQIPEAYQIVTTTSGERLHADLDDGLRTLDDALGTTDPREPLPGFTAVITGRGSWEERISRWTAAMHR